MELDLGRLPRTVAMARSDDGRAYLAYVDQRLLPRELVIARAYRWQDAVEAISNLAVRGAPALGICGAAAVALWLDEASRTCGEGLECGAESLLDRLCSVASSVASSRPTAVNLSWGVAQVRDKASEALLSGVPMRQVAQLAFDQVKALESSDEACCRSIGSYGAALLPQREGGCRVLTHCNAGSLACSFYGTALGVIYRAAEEGKLARVYADETRPVGQGARLTAWELGRAGVPVTLICDNMAASAMAQGMVDAVVVGADRIAANGDTANKIGTLGVAVLANRFGIPFFVAAPVSTIDPGLSSGSLIPIEERSAAEVVPCSLEGVDVWNPAFDVTPAELITAIVTERGAFAPEDILKAFDS